MSAAPFRADHNPDTAIERSRDEMLRLVRRNVRDSRVIAAMAAVRRERFVPAHLRAAAYEDVALPIGDGQTISQPLIVGIMLDTLGVEPNDRVLEVGTGSGYQAALLSHVAAEVITVERVPALQQRAKTLLDELGCANVQVFLASDRLGWPDAAPYDDIIVGAGAPHVPRALIEQLTGGGTLVLPVGPRSSQELVRVNRTSHGLALARLGPCVFVPLIGPGAW